MGSGRFTDNFKRDTVGQITQRGYLGTEVSKRLSVSQYSPCPWKRKFPKPPVSPSVDQVAEIRRLKTEPVRIAEERDLLKSATAYFTKDAK